MLYEALFRPALFRLDPEAAHERMLRTMTLIGKTPLGPELLSLAMGRPVAGLETEVLGLRFENPIGLAAGFDKDGKMTRSLPALGFGFLELGSITLKPQPGNPKPRIFRLPENGAIINRLGFNSEGAEAAAARLSRLPKSRVPVGINLGLNADCPKEEAHKAYAKTFRVLKPYGDYFVVNVSSPNTAGLRALQGKRELARILEAIQEDNKGRAPLLVKIDPDMPDDQLPDIVSTVSKSASGLIASNTTLTRPMPCPEIRGGLSGQPLRELSTALIGKLFKLSGGKLPIIGVGGVFSGRDAYQKIRAGASLIQLYTGLVYHGPGVVRRIQRELAELLTAAGFKSVREAVGTAS